MQKVKTGLDRLLEEKGSSLQLKRKAIGLISNCTGVTKQLEPGYQRLIQEGTNLKYLFGPEHGFSGARGEGVKVPHGKEETTDIPIISLYGDQLHPPLDILQELDVVIYDIQDLGTRCYTYIYTMLNCMEAAAKTETTFVILDRPAPLSGRKIEGKPVEESLNSFIGNYGLSMIYGLTPGELAKYVHGEFAVGNKPTVIKMEGWSRDLWFDHTDLPWVAPSPGIPTFKTALVYPATVFFEGTNVSEGRGTAKPFKWFGAPWMDYQLQEELERVAATFDCRGFTLRQCRFIPQGGKHEGELCRGYEIYVTDRNSFAPFQMGMLLMKIIRDLYPQHFRWHNSSLKRSVPYFDKLAGSKRFRKMIEGGGSLKEVMGLTKQGVQNFRQTASNYCLYG